ncbi:MAG: putative translation initiation inhibitor, yjgF family [Herbinix sp.]|jgi:enamine deaminase RidA (YjgF/YER057c/UK114 family)|nr:putative translation initiation inhibitor, yjgF family [Herbinix sp.]
MVRTNYSSGAPLEAVVGYSRMIKVGNHIYIGGTTSVLPDGTVYGEKPYDQAKYIFEKFIALLATAEANQRDVIKIKAYITDMTFAREVGNAFSEYFKEIKPLFTMVETPKLNRPTQYVEIELEAVIGCEVLQEIN